MTAPRDPFFPADKSIRASAAPIDVRELGLVDYKQAWDLQADIASRRAKGELPDTVLVLEHPSTFTAGKRTQPEDMPDPAYPVPVVPVDRGGRITWHGEGQLVIYPILKLAEPVDVVDYVRRLEEAIIQAVRELGVVTAGRVDGRSGVWVPSTTRAADPQAPTRDRKIGPGHSHHPRRDHARPSAELHQHTGVLRPHRRLRHRRRRRHHLELGARP